MSENTLCHHGVLGMKWGVRRGYQTKDGRLTSKGRSRLGLDEYNREHDSDITLKKGTKVSRVVSTQDYDWYADPENGGSKKKSKDVC